MQDEYDINTLPITASTVETQGAKTDATNVETKQEESKDHSTSVRFLFYYCVTGRAIIWGNIQFEGGSID